MDLLNKINNLVSNAKKIYLDDTLLSIENDHLNLKLKISKEESIITLKSLTQFNCLEIFEYTGTANEVSFKIPSSVKQLRCNKDQKIDVNNLQLEILTINNNNNNNDNNLTKVGGLFDNLEKVIPSLRQLIISKCTKYEYQKIKRLMNNYNSKLQLYVYDIYDSEIDLYT